MNRFKRSWLLLKSSLSVIASNKQLLFFPIVIFTCTAAIGLLFLGPPLLRPTGHSYFSGEHWNAIWNSLFVSSGAAHDHRVTLTPGAAAYFAFLYLVCMFIATFCNVAFYHEILAALSGQAVSVGRGLKFASSRLGAILLWTAFAGLVGFIIRMIEQRLSWVGQIIGGLIGLAWSVASVFVIPVIVREEKASNPFSMLRRSAGVLKQTWGEALIGYVGLGFANTVVMLLSVMFLVGAVVISVVLNNFWIFGLAAFAWFVAICVWSYVAGVASNVYRGALYLYAAEGTIPAPYDQEMLDMAWKFKKS
jgi:hypothetical protein